DGAMPDPAGDVLHLGHLNGSGSKIDLHLHRRVDHRVEIDEAGRLEATLEVALVNEAPAAGEPRYVIGSAIGLPDGTNRSILLLHTRHHLRSLTANGQPLDVVTTADGSLFVHQAMVDIAPASTVVLRAELVGVEPLAGPYELTLLPNGLLHRDETTVTVTDARGGSWEATPVVDRVVRLGAGHGRAGAGGRGGLRPGVPAAPAAAPAAAGRLRGRAGQRLLRAAGELGQGQ